MRDPNYDRFPEVPVPAEHREAFWQGWGAVGARLRVEAGAVPVERRAEGGGGGAVVVAVECHPGVFVEEVKAALGEEFGVGCVVDAAEALRPAAEVDALMEPWLGGDDPVFGVLCTRLELADLQSPERVAAVRARVVAAGEAAVAAARRHEVPVVVVAGPGAFLVVPGAAVLVYADLPRWEGQLRQRRGEVDNLGVANRGMKASLQYKRSYFVDWRVADRVKRRTQARWDFVLDTVERGVPRMTTGAAHRATLAGAARRPFRLVPFFDPGPWGGQWMKRVCGLDPAAPNYAWCFDGVPEENSLYLGFGGGRRMEVPAMNLVLQEPERLLGVPVHGRFGAEFPIRFDLLDTMGGGNLSLQVHPTTEFAHEQFGLRYTQDESYYLLDAEPGAEVILGCRRGVDAAELFAALEAAQAGGGPFPDGRFAAHFPARKHDHFLIPAGTLHCSGAGCMVLEISATPYIFTFKLWDWGRLGLDGKPRPVNLARGREVLRLDRDEDYAAAWLVNRVAEVGRGEGWREERTGLHEAEFTETRRTWFRGSVPLDTGGAESGGVNVLNLVEGEEAVVESPDGAFAPFVVHHAETFIVPAAVGPYVLRPHGRGEARLRGDADAEMGVMRAYVRTRGG